MKRKILRIAACALFLVCVISYGAIAREKTQGEMYYDELLEMAEMLKQNHIQATAEDDPIKMGLIKMFDLYPAMYQSFVNFMFQSYDPYSFYLDAKTHDAAFDGTTYVGGVGITIEIREDGAYVGSLVEGGGALKKNVSYTIEPKEITVAGEEKTVDALQSLMVGVVDLSKISDNTTIPVKLTLPENVQNTSGETSANVKLEFNGLASRTVETSAIEITNIPAGYTIEPVTNSLNVLLRGPEESLNKVLPQNVRAVVDLSNTVLTPGQHTIVANVLIDGTADVGAVGEYKVVIRVSK